MKLAREVTVIIRWLSGLVQSVLCTPLAYTDCRDEHNHDSSEFFTSSRIQATVTELAIELTPRMLVPSRYTLCVCSKKRTKVHRSLFFQVPSLIKWHVVGGIHETVNGCKL